MTLLEQLELNAEFKTRAAQEPVFGRIVRACFRQADFALDRGLNTPEARKAMREIAELGSYFCDSEERPTEGDIAESYLGNLKAGWTVAKAEAYAGLQRKRPARRPRERRTIAVKALDMRNIRMTWKEIAQKLCPCNKSVHDESCREGIRQRALPLKKLLNACENVAPTQGCR